MDSAKELKQIERRVISAVRKNPLFRDEVLVFGHGPCPCDLMVIGEAPGRTETKLGSPFTGRAGRFFVEAVESILKRPRQSIYITNVVKVWPRLKTKRSKTRPPTGEEIDFFLPYLLDEIDAVKPMVIISVGKTAFSALMKDRPFKPFSWERGFNASIMTVYHPAYILRRQRESKRLIGELKNSLKEVKERFP